MGSKKNPLSASLQAWTDITIPYALGWRCSWHCAAPCLCKSQPPQRCLKGDKEGREMPLCPYMSLWTVILAKADLKCLLAWQINSRLQARIKDVHFEKKMISVSCPGVKYWRDYVCGLTSGQISNNISRLPEATTVLAHKVFSMLRLSLTGGSPSSWKEWQNKYTHTDVLRR